RLPMNQGQTPPVSARARPNGNHLPTVPPPDRAVAPSARAECALELVSAEEWIAFATKFRLTIRELEALVLLFRAQPEKGIAGTLGLSVNTVHWLVRRLHQKLDVEDAVGLVLKVMEFIVNRLRPASSGA